MNIEIIGRHTKITPDIEDYARKRLERIQRFVRTEARIELVLDHLKERFDAELIVSGQRGPVVIGHLQGETAQAAIDLVVDKVDHQLRKLRDRKKHRHGESMAGEAHPTGEAGKAAGVGAGEGEASGGLFEGREGQVEDVVDEE